MEGWGERVVEDSQDDNLPEGWWQAERELETETSNNNISELVESTDKLQKKKQFQYKKGGKLNKAEIRELKKSCTSLLMWMTRPAIPTNPPPLPSSPTMNDAQEETDDMEWEEMGREEKLEIVRKKKEHWEVTRNARAIIVDLLEDAIAWAEEKPMRQLVNEIVLEGWRKMEIKRINNIIVSSDTEVQRRLMEGWVEKKAEEEALLLTLRLEEERQERLARIQLLKDIMKRKWDAKKLRQILRMMKQISLEDLTMEVDEVEARALEMMDVVGVTDESDMSVLEDGPCGECVSDQLMDVGNADHGDY